MAGKFRRYGIAPAHITMVYSHKPSPKNGVMLPAIIFLAWVCTFTDELCSLNTFQPIQTSSKTHFAGNHLRVAHYDALPVNSNKEPCEMTFLIMRCFVCTDVPRRGALAHGRAGQHCLPGHATRHAPGARAILSTRRIGLFGNSFCQAIYLNFPGTAS